MRNPKGSSPLWHRISACRDVRCYISPNAQVVPMIGHNLEHQEKGSDILASLNFQKLKQTELKPLLRHNDNEIRLKTNHTNTDINKLLTKNNVQTASYEEVCRLYDDLLFDLDSRPNKPNLRCDRVTAYAIEGVLPEAAYYDSNNRAKWVQGIQDIIHKDYPEAEVLAVYIHYDEVHTYTDVRTGELVESKPHMHMYVMPIVGVGESAKLCSAKFYPTPVSMKKFHTAVDNLTVNLFGCHYMDGTQKKSLGSVEELKVKSAKSDISRLQKEALELEQAVRNMRMEIRQQERLLAEREATLKEREQMAISEEISDFLKSEFGQKSLERYRISAENAHSSLVVPQKVKTRKHGGKIQRTTNESFTDSTNEKENNNVKYL